MWLVNLSLTKLSISTCLIYITDKKRITSYFQDEKLRSSQNVFKFLHPGVSKQYEEHNVDYNIAAAHNNSNSQPQVDKIANNFKKFLKIPKDVIDKVSNQLADDESTAEDDDAYVLLNKNISVSIKFFS